MDGFYCAEVEMVVGLGGSFSSFHIVFWTGAYKEGEDKKIETWRPSDIENNIGWLLASVAQMQLLYWGGTRRNRPTIGRLFYLFLNFLGRHDIVRIEKISISDIWD